MSSSIPINLTSLIQQNIQTINGNENNKAGEEIEMNKTYVLIQPVLTIRGNIIITKARFPYQHNRSISYNLKQEHNKQNNLFSFLQRRIP